MNKDFTVQHCDQEISSFIQWFFFESVRIFIWNCFKLPFPSIRQLMLRIPAIHEVKKQSYIFIYFVWYFDQFTMYLQKSAKSDIFNFSSATGWRFWTLNPLFLSMDPCSKKSHSDFYRLCINKLYWNLAPCINLAGILKPISISWLAFLAPSTLIDNKCIKIWT